LDSEKHRRGNDDALTSSNDRCLVAALSSDIAVKIGIASLLAHRAFGGSKRVNHEMALERFWRYVRRENVHIRSLRHVGHQKCPPIRGKKPPDQICSEIKGLTGWRMQSLSNLSQQAKIPDKWEF
jgi:hypothetical protein